MVKKRPVKPDDEFNFGYGSIARFGKNIVWQSNKDEEAHQALLEASKKRLPSVVYEINQLITEIVTIVSSNKPEELLKRAWWEAAAKHMKIEAEVEIGNEEIVSLRMIDYVQSIIASCPPSKNINDEVSVKDWKVLYSKIEQLFFKINLDFAICSTATEHLDNPDYSSEYEEFKFRARSVWCNVRGERFYTHQLEALRDLIEGQSTQIKAVYGVSASTLLSELNKIWHNQIFGLQEAMDDCFKFKKKTEAKMDILSKSEEHSGKSYSDLMELVNQDTKHAEEGAKIMARAFHLDLFDLSVSTNLPKKFLEDFSWGQGEEKEFFLAGVWMAGQ